MKRRFLITGMIVISFTYVAHSQQSPDVYSKGFIVEIIHKENEYQLKIPWKEFDDNWIRGTYYTGVMACYQATGEKKPLDQCHAFGDQLKWQLPAIEPNHRSSGLNLLTVGQTWLESYMIDPHGKKVLWSRGNGWALAGLVRMLKYLPKDNANYEGYRQVFVNLSEELKARQQSDGLWHPNLADPMDYGSKESSGPGFFTYALAWGINYGVLSKEEYLPVVKKAWEGLVSVGSEEGKVQWGQLVASSPYKVIEEDSHEYDSGMFLLAASEMYKME